MKLIGEKALRERSREHQQGVFGPERLTEKVENKLNMTWTF